MSFLDHLHQLTDPEALLQGFGPWVLVGLAVIVFIESGVLFPFLPGDSLLVTAAILRDTLETNVWAIITVAITAAVLGDQVGFFLGRRFGRRLFKPNARILKLRHLEEAEEFFAKYGPLALVLGRFVPIVRTYVPLAAGTAAMSYRRFVVWNISGAVFWVLSMVAIGVLLGGIPGIAHSIDLIMLVVIVMSVLPMIIAGVQRHRKQKRLDRTPSA
ncbi:DedA family protein [Corynebacterium heidelbergense]|uniref:DedA family protein n=1 Tax=Corynebacterium heidelbergense TaxID=2055947 RepID=UPI0015EFC238|nr:VTT domain-containing protein [Corynebacterium heidelbergense]WCZ36483.1 Inner membrane protein YqjA [Corynebacterium heidelbergense]